MNKLIAIFAAALFSFSIVGGTAYAAVDCDLFPSDPSCITNPGNGDPMAVTNGWGLTGYQTPVIAVGTTVVDAWKVQGTCDVWMGKMPCFNISKTPTYLATMTALFGNPKQ